MAAYDELEAKRGNLAWQLSELDEEMARLYDTLAAKDRPYSSLDPEFRSWSPDSLNERLVTLKARAQELVYEYMLTERAIDALPRRKRHPAPTSPLTVGNGGVVQQEPPPERRRGWLRRLFSRP